MCFFYIFFFCFYIFIFLSTVGITIYLHVDDLDGQLPQHTILYIECLSMRHRAGHTHSSFAPIASPTFIYLYIILLCSTINVTGKTPSEFNDLNSFLVLYKSFAFDSSVVHIQSCLSEYQITKTLHGTSVNQYWTTNAVTLQKTHADLQIQATSAELEYHVLLYHECLWWFSSNQSLHSCLCHL